MAQTSWYWDGLVTGDATLSPYSADEFMDIFRKLFQRDRTLEGVLPDYLGELTVTNPAGTTIRVSDGGALVDGTYYDNTANVDNSVVAPGSGSNFYTVVLRKGWAAQTVRVALLGPDAGSPPAVTQTDGVTWEISIATVEITSGSVITITDTRNYLHFNTEVSSAMIPSSAITLAKMAANSVDSDQYVDGSIDAVHLNDGAGSGVDADLLDGQEGAYYEGTLVDYSAISTITGWSSYTDKYIFYIKQGDVVTCWFIISGTSNATNAKFTLPDTNGMGVNFRGFARVRDNAVWQTAGFASMANASNEVAFGIDSGAGLFTASGTKSVEGFICFVAA